jgi:peptide/nickel transport system substrate-binding protein
VAEHLWRPTPSEQRAQQAAAAGQHLIDRRAFLRYSGMGAAVLGGAAALSACGSSSPPKATGSSPATTGKPKMGGTLQAGLTGGTSSDTVDAHRGVDNVDFARIIALYDPLIGYNLQAQNELMLAESMTPNKDATLWTVRLRPGVTFHDGKPLTAEDVVYSFNRIIKNNYAGASSLESVDVNGLKAVDKLTVQIPCHRPYATLPDAMTGYYYYMGIVPVGYDPKNPVGTGPFKYVSFTPGEQSTMVRNDHYWDSSDGPYVETLVITDYSDETSQVNAFVSGQADVINLLSAASIPQVQKAGNILVADGGGMTPFTMRVDRPPFNDPKVRQAFRLICNRPQMMDVVFGGRGTLGNDIFSPFDPAFDHAIPQRHQDIPQAKALLKAAGQEGLSVQLVTADIAQGTINVAQVFAQQAAAAGVTVSLRQVTSTEFYGSNYLKWVFAQDYWYYSKYLPQVAQATLPVSPFNETHWDDPTYNKLYSQAIATVDSAKRTAIAHEMQLIDHSIGGYIIPYFPPTIDGYAKTVQGVKPTKVGLSLGGYNFKAMWLA